MHELSVTQNLLAVVLEHAEKASAERVIAVRLCIGELAGIVEESLQFCFDLLSEKTLAAGARLVFHKVPLRLQCRTCGLQFEPGEGEWLCPCGAVGGAVVAGREFTIESIEVQ
ncbi:MAG: hydrogenase maturation nickel metallochaperone HypA [Anaerolineae bacterium]